MNRSLCVGAVLIAVLTAALAAPAGAAAPTAGSITRSNRTLSWSGATFLVSSPFPDPVTEDVNANAGFQVIAPVNPSCHTDSMCDHFALNVRMGDGARIEVKISTARPNPPGAGPAGISSLQPITGDDYDIYVYDPTGKFISGTAGTTEKGNERVVFTHAKRFNGKPY